MNLLKRMPALLLLLLLACAKEPLEIPVDAGLSEAWLTDSLSLSLVGNGAVDRVITHTLTFGGEGSVENEFFSRLNLPAGIGTPARLTPLPDLVKPYSERTGRAFSLLPRMFYDFPEGEQLLVPAGRTRSASKPLRISAKSRFGDLLEPGTYLLPLSLAGRPETAVYIELAVRTPFRSKAPLYVGEDLFFVFYVNTGQFDPRLAADYYLHYKRDWYYAIGNLINLRKSTVSGESGRPFLNLYPDLKYVLAQPETYILPVQETGRKVCLCIEGGGDGVGFCNLTEAQADDLAGQIVRVVDRCGLDGVNLWDRGSNYGREGCPPVNPASYPYFIKTLRRRLGTGRLLTLVDYEEPTGGFHDVAACGGVEVGKYLDYAWSGYNREEEGVQVIDPYHPGGTGVSVLHPRLPIPGLPPDRYGCLNIPWIHFTPTDPYADAVAWKRAGLRQSDILVYQDIRSIMQDRYEGSAFPDKFLHSFFREDNPEAGFVYTDRGALENPPVGYGKWVKNW